MKEIEMQKAALISAMATCARYVGLGILAIAAIVGFVFVAPIVADSIAFAWYGWARILTSNYTNPTAAVWVEWPSLIAGAWAVCVTVKVAKVDEVASFWFAGLATALALLGALPSQCALFAMTQDWTPDSAHTLIEKVAEHTVLGVSMLLIVVPVILFLWWLDTRADEAHA
jgi:hypothetical protein